MMEDTAAPSPLTAEQLVAHAAESLERIDTEIETATENRDRARTRIANLREQRKTYERIAAANTPRRTPKAKS